MPADLFPTGRDPLRRLGTTVLLAALMGVLAIVVAMVRFVQGVEGSTSTEWMLAVGFCLVFGGAGGGLAHRVLLDHRARIEALEKRGPAGEDRPVAGP
jgi:hypothetical protein